MKKMKFIKMATYFFAAILAFSPTYIKSNATSYNYDFWKNVIPSAEGIAYRDTYYNKDIMAANGSKETLSFDTLADMEVYDGDIYIIDANTTRNITYELGNVLSTNADGSTVKETVTATGVSYIFVVNQNMQWEVMKNEFLITDAVKEKLAAYYNFQTPLSEISAAQVTHKELKDRAPYVPYSQDNTKAAIRLRNAEGITVTSYGIFIADTENSRIIKLNFDYVVEDVFLTPEDSSFYQVSSGTSIETTKFTQFRPTKVAVDSTGKVFCISKDVYEGIIEFTAATKFHRFLGKNEVVVNALKKFWSKIMSELQIQSMVPDLPPLFTNITIHEDFIYATSYPDAEDPLAANMVKAINTSGKDILKRNGYVKPDGDVVFLKSSNDNGAVIGSSELKAVAISKTKNFTVVDSKRGRLFTYDDEGNLLYITGDQPGGTSSAGGGSSLSNSIVNPVAVDYYYRTNSKNEEEELILVLDTSSKSLLMFETTEFGSLVNKATDLYQKGSVEDAEVYWRQVVKMNTNYELAYLGIGKSLLRQNQFKEAMSYFELAHNGTYYSKAYSKYRDNILKENFDWIMTSIVILVFVWGAYKYVKYTKQKNEGNIEGGEE